MIPVFIVVEGQTEEAVVKTALGPHLRRFRVETTPVIVTTSRHASGRKNKGGGGNWDHWRNDIRRLCRDGRQSLRVTTFLDLYGFPTNIPGFEKHGAQRDTTLRCEALEAAMAYAINDRRFMPYIQRHELETLVLAALPSLYKLLEAEEDRRGLRRLEAEIGVLPPEEINDGPRTAPSKRIGRSINSYQKTLHGPLVIEDAGVAGLRLKCPRFDAWVASLEALGA